MSSHKIGELCTYCGQGCQGTCGETDDNQDDGFSEYGFERERTIVVNYKEGSVENEEFLSKYFEDWISIMLFEEDSYAFVEFKTKTDAIKALTDKKGMKIGGHEISIYYQ